MKHPLPCEHTFTVGCNQSEDLILIVAASKSAWRDKFIRLCLEARKALPALCRIRICFLGNPRNYDVEDLEKHASEWFEANARRASLIGPVLGALLPEEEATVVVLGNGPIFDLNDWHDSPFWPRLRLVNMGTPLQPSGATLPELTAPCPDGFRRSLYDPLSFIEIGGLGFLPLAWDPPALPPSVLQRCDKEGTFTLLATPPPTANLTVRCLLCPGEKVEVKRHRASGRVSRDNLVTQLAANGPANGRLTADEVTVLDQIIRGCDFNCPRCGNTHASSVLHCRKPREIIDRPVFPSLRCLQHGFVLFCRDDEGADYRWFGEALPLDDGRVALHDKSHKARLLQFDPTSALWLPTSGSLTPCHPLGTHGHGLLF